MFAKKMIVLFLLCVTSGMTAYADFWQGGVQYSDDAKTVLSHQKGIVTEMIEVLPSVTCVEVAALASHLSDEAEPVYDENTRIGKIVFSSPELTVKYRGLFDSYVVGMIDFRNVKHLVLKHCAIADTQAKELHLP